MGHAAALGATTRSKSASARPILIGRLDAIGHDLGGLVAVA
jgi:hypothetical protein